MKNLLLLFLVCSLAAGSFSCKKAPSNDTSAAGPETPRWSPDTLRILYQQFRQAQVNTWPTYQVNAPGTLYPVDQAPLDTALYVFREHLLAAVRKRDILPVMAAIDDNIQVGFGEATAGRSAFIKAWGLESPDKTQQSPLWRVLQPVLEGGGVFSSDKRSFMAPYAAATFPNNLDANTMGVITGEGVRLRGTPELNGEIKKTISYDLVTLLDISTDSTAIGEESFPWVKVRLADGKEGYVWGKFFRSPLEYRATFKQQSPGIWKLESFVKGD